jgi:hypothetical protein
MAKPRPTEIRLVASLLDPEGSGGEDALALAQEIIEALDESRAKREQYVLVHRNITGTPLIISGVFVTENQAKKYAESMSFEGIGTHKDVGAYIRKIREVS